MTDREKHISVLQNIDRAYRTFTQEEYRALEYAISSLKTDEAYQLMYEGEEIFTKADMAAILTDLYKRIRSYCDDLYSWGEQPSSTIILDIVQKEIDIFTEGNT